MKGRQAQLPPIPICPSQSQAKAKRQQVGPGPQGPAAEPARAAGMTTPASTGICVQAGRITSRLRSTKQEQRLTHTGARPTPSRAGCPGALQQPQNQQGVAGPDAQCSLPTAEKAAGRGRQSLWRDDPARGTRVLVLTQQSHTPPTACMCVLAGLQGDGVGRATVLHGLRLSPASRSEGEKQRDSQTPRIHAQPHVGRALLGGPGQVGGQGAAGPPQQHLSREHSQTAETPRHEPVLV